MWLWFKEEWTSPNSLCACSGASGTAEHVAAELSQFMDQFTKPAGTTFGLSQCAGLEPAVIQLLFGRGLLILGQLAGRWMEQLPAGRNFKLS